jgi:hypothetical protein
MDSSNEPRAKPANRLNGLNGPNRHNLLFLQLNGQLHDFFHLVIRNPTPDDSPTDTIFIQQNDVGRIFLKAPGVS